MTALGTPLAELKRSQSDNPLLAEREHFRQEILARLNYWLGKIPAPGYIQFTAEAEYRSGSRQLLEKYIQLFTKCPPQELLQYIFDLDREIDEFLQKTREEVPLKANEFWDMSPLFYTLYEIFKCLKTSHPATLLLHLELTKLQVNRTIQYHLVSLQKSKPTDKADEIKSWQTLATTVNGCENFKALGCLANKIMEEKNITSDMGKKRITIGKSILAACKLHPDSFDDTFLNTMGAIKEIKGSDESKISEESEEFIAARKSLIAAFTIATKIPDYPKDRLPHGTNRFKVGKEVKILKECIGEADFLETTHAVNLFKKYVKKFQTCSSKNFPQVATEFDLEWLSLIEMIVRHRAPYDYSSRATAIFALDFKRYWERNPEAIFSVVQVIEKAFQYDAFKKLWASNEKPFEELKTKILAQFEESKSERSPFADLLQELKDCKETKDLYNLAYILLKRTRENLYKEDEPTLLLYKTCAMEILTSIPRYAMLKKAPTPAAASGSENGPEPGDEKGSDFPTLRQRRRDQEGASAGVPSSSPKEYRA